MTAARSAGTRRTIDVGERRARLAVRHRLATAQRTDDVVRIADDLVALHSTDPVSVYLSVAARMQHAALEPLAAALYDDRTLVRHHAMRRTLWVFSTEVARLAHHAATLGLVRNQRRMLLAMLDVSDEIDDGEKWLAQATVDVVDALHRMGPSSARQLGKAVPALATKLQLVPTTRLGVPVAAHTRVLLLLGFEGVLVRTRPTGTWINGEYAWTPASDWVAAGFELPLGVQPADAAADLTRLWLMAFGPSTAADLQWWMGWTAGATKAALARAGAVEVDLETGDGRTLGWVAPTDVDAVATPEPWVALLPGLDPTTMGWKQRDWYLSTECASAVFDRNGNGGPTVWCDGRIVGGWVQRPTGEIAVHLVADVGAEHRAAIDSAAADLQVLLGATRFKVRFPAPMQAALLA